MILVFLMGFLCLEGVSGSHSWKAYLTFLKGDSRLPEFMAMHMVDDIQIMYYDSEIGHCVTKQDWMETVNKEVSNYWNTQGDALRDRQKNLKFMVKALMNESNQSSGKLKKLLVFFGEVFFSGEGGVHTFQNLYGCTLNDDDTTTGFWNSGYDGDDFSNFDTRGMTLSPGQGKSRMVEKFCSVDQKNVPHTKVYLEQECIEWLRNFLRYGKQKLERKGTPLDEGLFEVACDVTRCVRFVSPVRPKVVVYDRLASESNSIVLTCLATGFYPRAIDVSWVRDGETQMDSAATEGILPNEDETYQIRKRLEIGSEDKHNYTCRVEHSSTELPQIVAWAPSPGLKDGILVPVLVVSVLVLVLVLLLSVTGFVVWKKKKPGIKESGYNQAQQNESGDSSSNTSST
ncbi:DLA class I histocompatibility antigen, A9/A9 alpha chain-like [Latimeria chalumnae]